MTEGQVSKEKKVKKRKVSPQTDYFCQAGIEYIDYKDVATLERFVNFQKRIVPRKKTQLTAKNQRRVAKAIARARQMALFSLAE